MSSGVCVLEKVCIVVYEIVGICAGIYIREQMCTNDKSCILCMSALMQMILCPQLNFNSDRRLERHLPTLGKHVSLMTVAQKGIYIV